MRKTAALVLVILNVFASPVYTAIAGSVTGRATLGMQITQHAEQIAQLMEMYQQTMQQIEMVQDMIYNTLNLPTQLMGDLTSRIQGIMNIYNKLQGTLHSLSNLDEQFFNMVIFSKGGSSNKDWTENYSEQYWEMSVGLEEFARKALNELEISGETIMDAGQTLEKLQNNAATAKGRNALLQAQNDFLAFASGQLIELQRKADRQFEAYITKMEAERTLRDSQATILEEDLRKWTIPDFGPIEHSGWEIRR